MRTIVLDIEIVMILVYKAVSAINPIINIISCRSGVNKTYITLRNNALHILMTSVLFIHCMWDILKYTYGRNMEGTSI